MLTTNDLRTEDGRPTAVFEAGALLQVLDDVEGIAARLMPALRQVADALELIRQGRRIPVAQVRQMRAGLLVEVEALSALPAATQGVRAAIEALQIPQDATSKG